MKQIILFDGLEYGKKHPTDIDACYELNNKVFLFFEVKTVGNELTTGQRILLERLCKSLRSSGKKAYAFVVEHDIQPPQDIILADLPIKEVYRNEWVPPKSPCNVSDVIGYFNQ